MKSKFHAGVVFLFSFVSFLYATQPNFVKLTDIGIGTDTNGNKTDRISISYSNGLGKTLQTKSNLDAVITGNNPSDTTRFLTACTFYDEVGRPTTITKPFITTSENFLQGPFGVIYAYLNYSYNDYPGNPNRFAYSKNTYYNDPLSRVYESSVPGVNNSIASGNTTRQWFLGVGKSQTTIGCPGGKSILFQNGFIKGKSDNSALTASDLDSLYKYILENDSSFSDGTKYLLTITRDAGGKYSQTLTDLFNRTIGAASLIGGNKGVVVTSSNFDILGNLLEQTPPSNGDKNISSTKYLYNTLGQVIRKESPDRAVDSFVYNEVGLLDTSFSIVYNEGQSIIVRKLSYIYDDLQRLKAIVIPYTMGVTVLVENFYDKVDEIKTAVQTLYGMPTNFLDSITNCKGKLVASSCRSLLNRKWYYAIDVYSYNEDGNVLSKYKFVSGLPLQKTTFIHDIHGRNTSETVEIAGNSHTRTYSYDKLGRLSSISNEGTVLVSYSYDSLGRLDKKNLGSNLTSNYQYTINEQVSSLNSLVSNSSRFSETIGYKPDGNITSAAFGYNGFLDAPTSAITQDYYYDTLNRLVTVNSGVNKYKSSYAYDTIGRFTAKTEGSNSIANYNYYSTTNRLSMAKQASNDYFYDAFGNLVLDKKKKMVIEYDWRDLPVKFSYYNSIPDTITASSNGTLKFGQDSNEIYDSKSFADYMQALTAQNSGMRMLSTVSMVYDAGGNRVLKMESAQ